MMLSFALIPTRSRSSLPVTLIVTSYSASVLPEDACVVPVAVVPPLPADIVVDVGAMKDT